MTTDTAIIGARIHKPPTRGRGRGKGTRSTSFAHRAPTEAIAKSPDEEARDDKPPPPPQQTPPPAKVTRQTAGPHACSDHSLPFITPASGLQTTSDTNTIALNLMDHFLFSESNWLPQLSYCTLHAACFLMASRITGLSNSAEDVARALGPDTLFVRTLAAPSAEDEEAAAVIRDVISVGVGDVEGGYGLLYERREELRGLMGEYGGEVGGLAVPKVVLGEEEEEAETARQQDENLDLFEDRDEAA